MGELYPSHFCAGPFLGNKLALLSIILITALNIAFTFQNYRVVQNIRPPFTKEYTYVDGDFPPELPIVVPVAGIEIVEDLSNFDVHDDAQWKAFYKAFPVYGYTKLGPSNETFLLSMLHQLHCLDVIRVAHLANSTNPGGAEHVQHCLRFLRQTILCHADTTLEPTQPLLLSDGRVFQGAFGYGVVHKCRDWTVISRYLKEHVDPEIQDLMAQFISEL